MKALAIIYFIPCIPLHIIIYAIMCIDYINKNGVFEFNNQTEKTFHDKFFKMYDEHYIKHVYNGISFIFYGSLITQIILL